MKVLIYIVTGIVLVAGIAVWPYFEPPVDGYELFGIAYGYICGGIVTFSLRDKKKSL